MVDEAARTTDRLEAARWLADRGFGRSPQDVELALKAQEAVDADAFAAFAVKYLPPEMLDTLILGVEAGLEAREPCRRDTTRQAQRSSRRPTRRRQPRACRARLRDRMPGRCREQAPRSPRA